MIFPQVIEDIILDYCYQMKHKEKFQPTIQAINKINYTTGTFNDFELYLAISASILGRQKNKKCKGTPEFFIYAS